MANTKITSDNLDTLTTLTVDDITIDGSAISGSGNITLNAAGDIILDADGDDWKFHEGGTAVFEIKHESHGVDFLLNTGNEDWRFKGSDDGTTITALHLDISEAGRALFNEGIRLSGLNGGTGLAFDLAGSTDFVMKESSTNDVFQMGALYHNISSNALGIGTVPSYPLDITGSSNDLTPLLRGTATNTPSGGFNWATEFISANLANDKRFTHIWGKARSTYGMAHVSYMPKSTASESYLALGLWGANDILNVLGNGHVGIGTASPNVHSGTGLVIHATSGGTGATGSPRLRFTNTTTGEAATGGAELSLDGNTENFYIENREGKDIIFYSGSERVRIKDTGSMIFSDPDSGNYVASFTAQVKANAINVGPYATFGTDYSGWGTCLGWNVRPKIGTTNSGFEAATGYYAAGGSLLRMAGNTFGVTTWTATEIAGSTIGAGTTFISLAASGATTLGQNSSNLTDLYALKVLTPHGVGQQGSHNSSYFHHDTDRPYYYFSTACYASGGFHTYSDEKLKKNITTISGALDDVAKMNGVTFNWRDPEARGSGKTGKQFGVIAQNMLEVDPELPLLENDPLSPEETIETDESYYSMDYSRLTPYFIEAIKELKEKLETAEARITELENG